MKNTGILVGAIFVLACGTAAMASTYDVGKVQVAGCYVELAQQPVPVAGGYEYIIDFYTQGAAFGSQDYGIWGFENDRIANFYDITSYEGVGWERTLMEFWTHPPGTGSVHQYLPAAVDDGQGGWALTAYPWSMDNPWHTPSEYAWGWEAYHVLPAVDAGNTYWWNYDSGMGPAGADMIHMANDAPSAVFGHGEGLLFTLRLVVPDTFDFGDVTWSMPTYYVTGDGDHTAGGLFPVLGNWEPIPEPATLGLLALGACLPLLRKRW